MSGWPIECYEMRQRGLIPQTVKCCSSCHDDAAEDESWGEPPTVWMDDKDHHVCCTVAEYLVKQQVAE